MPFFAPYRCLFCLSLGNLQVVPNGLFPVFSSQRFTHYRNTFHLLCERVGCISEVVLWCFGCFFDLVHGGLTFFWAFLSLRLEKMLFFLF